MGALTFVVSVAVGTVVVMLVLFKVAVAAERARQTRGRTAGVARPSRA